MSQQSQSDANASHQADAVPQAASQAASASAPRPAALFKTGHEDPKPWPATERRSSERRENERREMQDRRQDDRRDDERRSAEERRVIAAPVNDPELKLEDGGLWPSLDWRPGNRKLEDRRASDRRADERRAGQDRRNPDQDRRQGDRRAGGAQYALENADDFDDLAEAGDYKGALD